MNNLTSTASKFAPKPLNISAGARKVLLGVVGLSGVMIAKSEVDKQNVSQTINLKKERLSMPVYELTGDELVNFPWNHDNIDEWLYRPVKFKGRQIHKHTMYPKSKRLDFPGADYILPVVTREDDEWTHASREGILLNKGWIPEMYIDYTRRMRVEDSENYIEFVGYITHGENLEKGLFSREANTWGEQRFNFTTFHLPDMVDASELTNKKQAKVAMIELVDLNTPLDEKNTQHYDLDMTGTQAFPYVKTRAGALQSSSMPWHYESRQSLWALVGGISGLIVATAKVVR